MRVRDIRPGRLARLRRPQLVAFPLLLSAALAAVCLGSQGSPAAASVRGAAALASGRVSADPNTWVTTVPTGPPPSEIVTNCLISNPQQCYTPQVLRTAYGIAPLLDKGIDGRGK